MKTVLRQRYYCDYCKKAGGHAGCMRKHEARCTLNPNRECGMCNLIQECPVHPRDHVSLVFAESQEQAELNLKKLKEACHDCPACILSVIRFAWKSIGMDIPIDCHTVIYDFKAESKAFIESLPPRYDNMIYPH